MVSHKASYSSIYSTCFPFFTASHQDGRVAPSKIILTGISSTHYKDLWQNSKDNRSYCRINRAHNYSSDSFTIDSTQNQLQKQSQLKELDRKIIAAITEERELEDEICEIEEYQTALIEKIE